MTPNASTQQILVEHRQLLDAAEQLEEWLDAPARHEDTAMWRAALARQLSEFTVKLSEHFVAEVETTSLDPSARDPVLAEQLRELDEEHQTLSKAFEQATRMAAEQDVAPEQICRHVQEAIRGFREHEAKEDVLFGFC